MKSRDKIFGQLPGSPTTFANDILAPNLPLPDLSATLEQYYESLIPFASARELIASKQNIEEFKSGAGRILHTYLEELSKNNKNWSEELWDKYAYSIDRTGILPLRAMGAIISTGFIKLDITSANRLKATARLIHSTLEYFILLRNECLKQDSYGSVKFSMHQYRRLFNSLRIPGLQVDNIKSHFKTVSEGDAPRNIILILTGKIFSVEFFDRGDIMAEPLILKILEEIFLLVGSSAVGSEISIPILSCDNRSTWAANRKHLQDLSPKNRKFLEIIEKSIMIVSFDEHGPRSWEETALHTLSGDLVSKWADKSLALVSFKNGKFGYIGEHGCFDGTILNSLRKFHMLSMLEFPEPNWNEVSNECSIKVKNSLMEIMFDVDDRLESESRRLIHSLKEMQTCLIISSILFHGYGSSYIKDKVLYADGYLQMIIQLTYYKMHFEFPPTYETALLRQFYNGRTETVRSCTQHSVNWILSFLNATHSNNEKFENLKKAVDGHKRMMNIARSGKGIDRHLFGLRCATVEMNLEVPDLFKDPLYGRSGGNGNFVLSTSTLGHSTLLRSGFIAPMIQDGYGVFYCLTDDSVWFQVTAFRESNTTNAYKFGVVLKETLLDVKRIIDSSLAPKL